MINPSQRPLPDNTQHSQRTNIQAPGAIRTHDRSRRAAVDGAATGTGYVRVLASTIDQKISAFFWVMTQCHSVMCARLSEMAQWSRRLSICIGYLTVEPEKKYPVSNRWARVTHLLVVLSQSDEDMKCSYLWRFFPHWTLQFLWYVNESIGKGYGCYGVHCGQPKNRHNEVSSKMSINHRHKQRKDRLR